MAPKTGWPQVCGSSCRAGGGRRRRAHHKHGAVRAVWLYSESAVAKARRTHRTSKAPKGHATVDVHKSSVETPDREGRAEGSATPPEALRRTTIPVQDEWLESEHEPHTPLSASNAHPTATHVPRTSAHARAQGRLVAPPPLPADDSEGARRELQRLQRLHPARDIERFLDQLQDALKGPVGAGLVKVTTAQGDTCVSISTEALFPSGGTRIHPEGMMVLDEIGTALSSAAVERCRVESHASVARAAEWRLSASRAAEVANRFASRGTGARTVLVAVLGELGVEPSTERRRIVIRILQGQRL